MRVLVTGGTGVIGTEAISELIRSGHQVRLLSRHAREDARQWHEVEPYQGDISDAASLQGAADGCDAILHIAGLASDDVAALETVNVTGTSNMLNEAQRAGLGRFIYVSSLGAERGASNYHQSKRKAESLVSQSTLDWTIVRPGNVYGPGDEVISLLLRAVRALPVVPLIDHGKQPFQPIWHEDLAKACAKIVERDDLTGQTLEIAGQEVTSMEDLLDRLAVITDRKPVRVPIPQFLASLATSLGAAAGVTLPIDQSRLTMLQEENVIEDGRLNAMDTLAITPTPLDRGLRLLADAQPEQLADEGVGALQHKSFFAEISGSRLSAASLMTWFRDHAAEVMPIEFDTEPGTPQRLDLGATLTAKIPMRGNIQVRVESTEATRVVLATLVGHPLAGTVEFTTSDLPNGLRFAIDTYTRSANTLDLVALKSVGAPMQDSNWKQVVQRVIDASGGTSSAGVQNTAESLDDEAAHRVEARRKQMVQKRKRDEAEEAGPAIPQRP